MSSSKIRLEPVNANNWKACAALEIAADQENFVPSNLYSIAESQFYSNSKSRAICNQDDQIVGFALFGCDIFTGKWKIFRIMIDKSFQQRGYGKSAMREIISQISREPDGGKILICYQDDNLIARKLYARLGFVEQEIDNKGKVTALLMLSGN